MDFLCNAAHENIGWVEWGYSIDNNVQLKKDGIFHKTERSMKVFLGLSHQIIQIAQSGFNTEQSLNDCTLEEIHPTLISNIKTQNICYSSYKTMLTN